MTKEIIPLNEKIEKVQGVPIITLSNVKETLKNLKEELKEVFSYHEDYPKEVILDVINKIFLKYGGFE